MTMRDIAEANVKFFENKVERAQRAYNLAEGMLENRIALTRLEAAQNDLHYWRDYARMLG